MFMRLLLKVFDFYWFLLKLKIGFCRILDSRFNYGFQTRLIHTELSLSLPPVPNIDECISYPRRMNTSGVAGKTIMMMFERFEASSNV
jgi:hypothetical protein